MMYTTSYSSTTVVRIFLACCLLPMPITLAAQPDNTKTGSTRLFSEIKRCVQCHIEQFKASSEPLDQVASYTRHRKQGFCRTHAGGFIQEHDASTCPDHHDGKVRHLLELCFKAVTYHLPTGEISVVEADPIPGKRDRTRGGPYAQRITQKPQIQYAQLCIPSAENLPPSLRLLDSRQRVLATFECREPLKKIETETGIVYEIPQHILNQAQQYLELNMRTATEIRKSSV